MSEELFKKLKGQVTARIIHTNIEIIKVLTELARRNDREARRQILQERMEKHPECYLVYIRMYNVIYYLTFKVRAS